MKTTTDKQDFQFNQNAYYILLHSFNYELSLLSRNPVLNINKELGKEVDNLREKVWRILDDHKITDIETIENLLDKLK